MGLDMKLPDAPTIFGNIFVVGYKGVIIG